MMPVYELKCEDCSKVIEVSCSYSKRPKKCSECGGKLSQVFYPPAIAFKGSGFYTTDYN
jgi:putative FmdB family regulatory protein